MGYVFFEPLSLQPMTATLCIFDEKIWLRQGPFIDHGACWKIIAKISLRISEIAAHIDSL